MIITTSSEHAHQVGDRIDDALEPRAVHYRVVDVHDAYSVEVRAHRRPSRGWARRIRKEKARR